MFTRFHTDAMEQVGTQALEAMEGLGVSLLTNQDWCYKHRPDGDEPKKCHCNAFWYVTDSFKTRFKQEKAKVGDTFYDGNNGDKHIVVAVNPESSRLVYRNLDQNEDILMIACW